MKRLSCLHIIVQEISDEGVVKVLVNERETNPVKTRIEINKEALIKRQGRVKSTFVNFDEMFAEQP